MSVTNPFRGVGQRLGAPKRVVHVVLDLHEGGLERVVTDLVQSADPMRTESTVLCLQRRGRLANELAPGQVVLAPSSGPSSMLLPLTLARTLTALAPDIVHVHSGAWYKAVAAARLARLGPVVCTDHGRPVPDTLSSRGFDALGAAGADLVVAVSHPLADYLRTRLHVRRRKLVVIPNGIRLGVRPSAAAVARIRTELGLGAGVPVLGTVGRLDAVKAHEFLLSAFRRLRAEWGGGPLPVLLIAGDGPERARLLVHAAEEGLQGAVQFLGWRTDVSAVLELIDLFVLPSDSEGTSISLLEAMASERCVVATAVGGNPDVLGNGLQGQLVPARDVSALVALMRNLLRDPDRRAAIGRRSRERVRASYSVEAMAGGYEALYDRLLARAGA